jgi:alpha/beta superfamily hydrolase
VPFSELLDWTRDRSVPVVVIPGATHFFHGKLLLLKQLVLARLSRALT